ncbi:GntR family transcriptional regulator [Variovorax sp. dw_308]|nr:GntR family transcriptional regulator [Variovorax sp. dw_308]
MTTRAIKLTANGTVLHRQLFVLLKEQIVSGRLRNGDKLPTQDALCTQFSVSRITVRRALTDLEAEGLVRNEQGAGAFVTAEQPAPNQLLNLGFVDDLRRQSAETTVKVLSLDHQRCPYTVAQALRIDTSASALHVVRVRSRSRLPVMLLDAWIPQEVAASVTREALRSRPLYELIAGGDNLGRVVQQVNAALADPVVAAALQVEVNSAVLKVERLLHRRDDVPIQFMTVWSTPQRTRLVMDVDAEHIDGLNAGLLLHDVA